MADPHGVLEGGDGREDLMSSSPMLMAGVADQNSGEGVKVVSSDVLEPLPNPSDRECVIREGCNNFDDRWLGRMRRLLLIPRAVRLRRQWMGMHASFDLKNHVLYKLRILSRLARQYPLWWDPASLIVTLVRGDRLI